MLYGLLMGWMLACSKEVVYPVPAQPKDLGEKNSQIDEQQRIKCRHILIQYKGALNTDPMLERSRFDAYQMAYQIYLDLQAGADFASLAQQHSDGPSASYGGELPPNYRGSFDAHFENSVFNLQINEISKPVESSFGWHIIQRQENIEGQFVHIMVSHMGTRESRSNRSKAEAEALIYAAREAILAGQDPQAVAAQYSEGPAGSRGGMLGWISAETLHPEFKKAAFGIAVGELSEPIHSPYGFHLFIRYK